MLCAAQGESEREDGLVNNLLTAWRSRQTGLARELNGQAADISDATIIRAVGRP